MEMRQMDTRSGSQCSVTPEAILNNEQLVLPPRISRVNGWSLPLHYFQVVTWAVFVGLSSATFGIFIPLLPHVWKYIAYVVTGGIFSFHLVVHLIASCIDPADSNVRLKKNYSQPMPIFDRSKHAHVIQNQFCHLCRVTVCSVRPWQAWGGVDQHRSPGDSYRPLLLTISELQPWAHKAPAPILASQGLHEAKKMTTFGYLIKTCKEESSKHQAVRKDPYMQMEEGFLQQGDGALGSSAQGVKAKSSLLIYKCPCHFCTSVNPDRGSTAREADDAPSTSTLGFEQCKFPSISSLFSAPDISKAATRNNRAHENRQC
ncbi:probable palmitoyltransferase ZDHHC11B [Pongo pygmaeus]|uniref:probable palmitoyltransferase ZDHHC11B n=1 Tax=Pongo pygmaeus TaxID=9600 RepID=UPI00300DA18E